MLGYSLPQVAKALVASAATAVGALGASMADGDLTGPEAIVSLGAGLVALAAVFKTENAPVEVPVDPQDVD